MTMSLDWLRLNLNSKEWEKLLQQYQNSTGLQLQNRKHGNFWDNIYLEFVENLKKLS